MPFQVPHASDLQASTGLTNILRVNRPSPRLMFTIARRQFVFAFHPLEASAVREAIATASVDT